jgi:hypothetical protein
MINFVTANECTLYYFIPLIPVHHIILEESLKGDRMYLTLSTSRSGKRVEDAKAGLNVDLRWLLPESRLAQLV